MEMGRQDQMFDGREAGAPQLSRLPMAMEHGFFWTRLVRAWFPQFLIDGEERMLTG